MKGIYIVYYDNFGKDTAEIFVGEGGTNKEALKYLRDVCGNEDVQNEDIEGVYSIRTIEDAEGNSYHIEHTIDTYLTEVGEGSK